MLSVFSAVPYCIEYSLDFVGQYEPELFPGLIYRMKQPKIVLLIFVSGKIVLTGAKVMSYVCLLLEFLGSSLLDLYLSWMVTWLELFYVPTSGERWDIYSVWEHIPCPYWVPEEPTMVCLLVFWLCYLNVFPWCSVWLIRRNIWGQEMEILNLIEGVWVGMVVIEVGFFVLFSLNFQQPNGLYVVTVTHQSWLV